MSGKKGDKNRDRSRSPTRAHDHSDQNEGISIEDLRKVVADAVAAQLPTVIIEASKVAKETLSNDRDETHREMAAQIKKLKQEQEDLALISKASGLKSEGNRCNIAKFISSSLPTDFVTVVQSYPIH